MKANGTVIRYAALAIVVGLGCAAPEQEEDGRTSEIRLQLGDHGAKATFVSGQFAAPGQGAENAQSRMIRSFFSDQHLQFVAATEVSRLDEQVRVSSRYTSELYRDGSRLANITVDGESTHGFILDPVGPHRTVLLLTVDGGVLRKLRWDVSDAAGLLALLDENGARDHAREYLPDNEYPSTRDTIPSVEEARGAMIPVHEAGQLAAQPTHQMFGVDDPVYLSLVGINSDCVAALTFLAACTAVGSIPLLGVSAACYVLCCAAVPSPQCLLGGPLMTGCQNACVAIAGTISGAFTTACGMAALCAAITNQLFSSWAANPFAPAADICAVAGTAAVPTSSAP